jgi:hypothetical protein
MSTTVSMSLVVHHGKWVGALCTLGAFREECRVYLRNIYRTGSMPRRKRTHKESIQEVPPQTRSWLICSRS